MITGSFYTGGLTIEQHGNKVLISTTSIYYKHHSVQSIIRYYLTSTGQWVTYPLNEPPDDAMFHTITEVKSRSSRLQECVAIILKHELDDGTIGRRPMKAALEDLGYTFGDNIVGEALRHCRAGRK